MKNKTKNRLTALLGVLMVFLCLFFARDSIQSALSSKPDTPYSKIEKDYITAITIENPDKTQLIKKNNQWVVKEGTTEYRADESRVTQVIDHIAKLEKKEIVSTNKNRHKELGIGTRKVTFKSGDTTYVLHVGNSTGTQTLARLNDDSEVFSTASLEDIFSPPEYRNLALPYVQDEQKVTTVSLNYDGLVFDLTKSKDAWTVNEAPAKKEQVEFLLTDLKSLRADEISTDEELRGTLTIPAISISINEGGKDKTLNFYSKDEASYYAVMSESPYIYTVGITTVDSLKKDETYFTE